MNNTPTPKIIQLLMSPNDSVWQGVLLGLGNDGMTYHCQGDTWQPYIPPLEPQDKATELTAVTKQRDKLAEAIRLTLMENLDLCDGDICTLKRLKDAVGFDLDSLENTQDQERTAFPASDCSEI